jgi:hypothetical protein
MISSKRYTEKFKIEAMKKDRNTLPVPNFD